MIGNHAGDLYKVLIVLMMHGTVKALIKALAFIRIITYHRERGGHLLEASQLTFYLV